MTMTSEELRIAAEFESGWTDERLDAADINVGPGLVKALPAGLIQQVFKRADAEGISPVELIHLAISDYLSKGNVA